MTDEIRERNLDYVEMLQKVLDGTKDGGTLSPADIRIAGRDTSTITSYVENMIAEGLIAARPVDSWAGRSWIITGLTDAGYDYLRNHA